ncbi:ArsR/SmtB family transcription factor [Yoonia sp. 2307UL14-13]|uniref:ArsR/SmtB family transcription factor n=1 Tax=Yoonia sp. 2307UL14-13 TaxID=3126506 RepID=UPI0030A0E3E6
MQKSPEVFAALADPTRLGLLGALAQGEKTVNELVAPFDMSQPAISRHLKILEAAGLITRRVDGTKRPCRLAPEGLAQIETWASMMRRAYAANYDRLDAVLADISKGEKE